MKERCNLNRVKKDCEREVICSDYLTLCRDGLDVKTSVGQDFG